jgi:hypothetical protein
MKQIKVIKTLLILTLLTNIFITPLQVQSSQTQNTKPPEVDPERLRVNQTETIPKDYMHTNTPGDPQQLQFKNMVLELTTTRKMTMSITSDEQVRFQYLSMTMEMTQNMQMNMQMTQSPPENIPEPENGLKKYLTIEPNSSDPIRTTMRLYLNQEEIPEDSTIEQFTWCYWNGTHWDPTPTRYTYDGFLETNTTHLSIWTVKEKQAERPREIPAPDSPGLHAETKAYNYTDTTPSGFQYKMSENTPTMLQFRNSAIYMHCTSPVELEYSAEEQNRNRLMRVEVESETPLQLRFNLRESKPDEVGVPDKGLGFFCEIEPNQTITQARLGYEVDPVEAQSKGVNAEKLCWAFWNGSHWESVETTLNVDGVLEAETDHLSVWTIIEQQKEKTREMQLPDSPGLHAETKAYNYTDTTPSGFQYKMSEDTPTMLQFRNSAIYMHCTSPVELEYSAEEQNRNRLIRVEVEADDPLRLKFNLRESKPDDVSTPEKGIGFYCEIEPNQTMTQARLGYEIDPVELQSRSMEPERLSWAYWSGNQWQMVESSLSTENVLEAETDHFSTWTILELEEVVEEPEDSGDNLIPIPSYAIAVGLLVTVVVMMRKTQ